MIETASSRINNAICDNNKILIMVTEFINIGPVFPRRVNNKWPAIIFAAKRTDSVSGRIKFLIVSIHTINGIKIGGVPWGTKWANICCVLLIHP